MEALKMDFSIEELEKKINGEKWTPELGKFLVSNDICFEVIDGLICVKSKPFEHDSAKNVISLKLNSYLKENNLACKSAVEMRISRNNGGDYLIPDVIVLGKNEGKFSDNGMYLGIPKLVIEVLSLNRKDDLNRKLFIYAEMGIPEYWTVDLDGNSITQYVLSGSTYGGKHINHTEGVISHHICGLTLNVEELFHDIIEELEFYLGNKGNQFSSTSLFN